MFLHLGSDVMIYEKEVLGVFAYESKNISPINKEFIDSMRSENKIVEITEAKKAKSLVLTNTNLYFSPISSNTLQKRVHLSLKDMCSH